MAKRSEPGANPKPDQKKARWTPFPGWQRVWIYLVVGGSLAVILVYLLIWRQMAGAVPIPSNITHAPALGLQAPIMWGGQ